MPRPASRFRTGRAWDDRRMSTEVPVSAIAPSLAPTDGPLTFEELQLATRNRGMPLEALRYDVTPTGLHYLLTHFDIPAVDPSAWRLSLSGRVREPLELDLDDIRDLPRHTLR